MDTATSARRSRGGRIYAALSVAGLAATSLLTGAATGPPVAADPATPAAAVAVGQIPTEGRFFDPVFDEVELTEDLAYREATNVDGELQTLHLDLYQPVGDTAERRPVVVLIHGGFFVFGNNKDDSWGAGPSFARPFVERGYVVASIQYRLRPDMGQFPDVDFAELEAANLDAHDDAVGAVAWLRDHAAELRLDPEAIVPVGPSAGGSIAWNLAWLPGSSARPGPPVVPAAVSVAGAAFESAFTTGEPLAAATAGDPPVLAIHGTEDSIVPFPLAEGPCSRAAAVGVRCDLVPLEGVGHPGVDPAFLSHLSMIIERELAFVAEVVLEPLGYFEGAPPTEPPPGSGPHTTPPTAPPAQPVTGTPTFTG
jgi:acetyl esterase/lipase